MTEEWRVQMMEATVVHGHSRADGLGRPIGFLVTGGQTSDSRHLQPLAASAAAIRRPDVMFGDKGYDNDENRGSLLIQGIRPVIPSMRSRKVEILHDKALYRQHNRIELMTGEHNQSRKVATGYEKTISSFEGFITLAVIKLWSTNFIHIASSSAIDPSTSITISREWSSSVVHPREGP